MNSREVKVSKFLSLVLRHKPEEIGIQLDEGGWTPVDNLLAALNSHGLSIMREELEHIVSNNEKKRFAFSDNGQMIRANQGHSVEVELGYTPQTPPEILYHGTVEKFLPSIKEQGLIRGQRHHVHLSPDRETAIKVGQRRGKPIVLTITSGEMNQDGLQFYLSKNGVWLTDSVPPRYLIF